VDVNRSHLVSKRLRVIRYFGLANDPAAPTTLRRPVYGRVVWFALTAVTTAAAIGALRIGGASWASISQQMGVQYLAGLALGVALPLVIRRGSRNIQIVPAEPGATVIRSRWPWLKIFFITLGIVSAAHDHSGGLSVMLLPGMWLGSGFGNELVHRRIERRAGMELSAAGAAVYYAVTDPALSHREPGHLLA